MREEPLVRVPIRLKPALVAAVATAAVAGFAGPAFASTAAPSLGHYSGASHAVFVQTDSTSGNHVVAYQRAANGVLSLAGSYATGGLGGILGGSVVSNCARC
jgi:hypothetical protein